MRVKSSGDCPRAECDARGRWVLPVTVEPDGYGTTGAVRALVALQVDAGAGRDEAQAEAERVWRSMGTRA